MNHTLHLSMRPRRTAVGLLLMLLIIALAILAVPHAAQATTSPKSDQTAPDKTVADKTSADQKKLDKTEAEHAAFILMAGEAAKSSRSQYGVPESVTVAQAILESGWGKSQLTTVTKNHFGMKCFDQLFGKIATSCADSPTVECNPIFGCYETTAAFRVYKSVADSFADHAQQLHESARYKPAFKYTKDADQFIREVHKAGYATDPKYTDKIINLMKQYDLYRFNIEETPGNSTGSKKTA